MKLKLTIELDCVKVEVEAYFDNDEAGAYLEEVYICKTSDLDEMQAWSNASQKEQDNAIWKAYNDYVKASNEL